LLTDEGDGPTLPVTVGDVFYAPRDVYDPTDPKEGRWLLVVAEPTDHNPQIVVRTRTSKTKDTLGVGHPAEPKLGLHKPGRWQPHEHKISPSVFTADNGVEALGPVRSDILDSVLKARREGR
jgi:hypothetical protein